MEYIKILFTVVVAAAGWIITNYYTSRRDIKMLDEHLVLKH